MLHFGRICGLVPSIVCGDGCLPIRAKSSTSLVPGRLPPGLTIATWATSCGAGVASSRAAVWSPWPAATLAVALGLAALLELLALLGAFPQWVVVAVPLAYFVVAVVVFAVQGPIAVRAGAAARRQARPERPAGDGARDRGARRARRARWSGARSPTRRGSWRRAARTGTRARRGRVATTGRCSAGSSSPWRWSSRSALATGGSSSSNPQALGPNGNGGAPRAGPANITAPRPKKSVKSIWRRPGNCTSSKARNVPPSEQQSTKAGGYQRIPQGQKSNGKETKGAGSKVERQGHRQSADRQAAQIRRLDRRPGKTWRRKDAAGDRCQQRHQRTQKPEETDDRLQPERAETRRPTRARAPRTSAVARATNRARERANRAVPRPARRKARRGPRRPAARKPAANRAPTRNPRRSRSPARPRRR